MRVPPLLTSNSSSQQQVDSTLWKNAGNEVAHTHATLRLIGSRVCCPLTEDHSDWLRRKRKKKGQLINLRIFVMICLSVYVRDVIQELKQRLFLSGAHKPEVVFFAFFGTGFAQIWEQIVSVNVKTRRYTNLVVSNHTKRKKASVSVDVRRSKKSLLKLPLYPLVPSKENGVHFCVACVASVSMRFRSKERGTRVKDRVKNDETKRAGRGWGRKVILPFPLPLLSFFWLSISRTAKTENPVPRSFFAPKPNGNACYAS